MVGAELKGSRVDRFTDFKDATEAASDSEAIRHAVDLAYEAKNDVGSAPHVLQSEIEKLEAENKQLQNRLDEKDTQISELETENQLLFSLSPLEWYQRFVRWAFMLGVFGIILMLFLDVQNPQWWDPLGPIAERFFMIFAISLLASVAGTFAYIGIFVFKIVAPGYYRRVSHWVLTRAPLKWVVDDIWIPEIDDAKKNT